MRWAIRGGHNVKGEMSRGDVLEPAGSSGVQSKIEMIYWPLLFHHEFICVTSFATIHVLDKAD